MAQARVLLCFDISRYLTDKYFDIVWGGPPNGPFKNQFFERLKVEFYFFFDISRYLTDKYFDIVWECHPPGTPPNVPPKNQFFEWLNLGCQCFMI